MDSVSDRDGFALIREANTVRHRGLYAESLHLLDQCIEREPENAKA
jgi:hypothetical protein